MGAPLKINEGDRYGKLTIVREVEPKFSPSGQKYRMAELKCDCGNTITRSFYAVKNKLIQSCGCRGRGPQTNTNPHNHFNYYYRLWCSIKRKLYNPNYWQYRDWGGRGMEMDSSWKNNFDKFYKDLIQMIGERPTSGMTLDRIDNNYGYFLFQKDGITPQLRWASRKTQANNRRPRAYCKITRAQAREIRALKNIKTAIEIANEYGISKSQVYLIFQRVNWKEA